MKMKTFFEKEHAQLLPCPFCGRGAIYRGLGVCHDPFTGDCWADEMVGCPSAFSPRGDWGAEPEEERCLVAPSVRSTNEPGIDVIEAWNKRAEVK